MRNRILVTLTLLLSLLLLTNRPAMAGGVSQTTMPSAVPASFTPAINDGQVNAIVQVGSTMVAGGTFAHVTPVGGAQQSRAGIVAFDASTGALRAFNPALGGTVQALLPGPTAGTVYAAGNFTSVGGTSQSHVTLLDANTGAVISTFHPASTNGAINTLAMAQGRLLVGGTFTTAGGQPHGGLAALNPTTGALDNAFMSVDLAGHHNNSGGGAQGAVGVKAMEATSSGDRLVAVGNFRTADGLDRVQIVVVDMTSSGSTVDPSWATTRYQPLCYSWAFDTYMRGVSISPDDSYFVVTATGGYNAGTLCDTASRFEFSAQGSDIQPTWVDYTGGDTLEGVDVAGDAVYIGGHQRWTNNSDAGDSAGQGAVPRPGLSALDPDSGMPLAWNPGRNPRGAGAFAILATASGVWVGSDTEWVGNYKYKRPRISFFPLAGGAAAHSEAQPGLPGTVYVGAARSVSQGNVLYRVDAGGPEIDAVDGGPDWAADDSDPSPYRNSGSNSAGYGPVAGVDPSVPATTPHAIFDTERWSPSDSPRMSWSFPVGAGLPIEVRLFFANRYGGTSSVGSRVFDVDLDGTRVLDHYDIVASAGDQTGTMQAFDITSDGTVNIDFSHEVENPLIDGVEIVRRDLPPPTPPTSGLSSVTFDGNTPGTPTDAGTRGIDWTAVKGAFLVGGTLVTAQTDGYLHENSFTASSTGPDVRLDPYHDPTWDGVVTGSGNTYDGVLPAFYGEIDSLTGLTYAHDRVYYTRSGRGDLYWRWFNIDSGVVGSQEFTADGGLSWSDTGGLFTDGSTLYVVSRSTGHLSSVHLDAAGPSGSLAPVDGSIDWRGRALFIGPGAPANQPPTAAFTASCAGMTCAVDASGSADPDGSVASYAWRFGDGATASGVTASHTYGSEGTYPVTLTVTDDRGATATTTRSVTATAPPATSVSFVAAAGATANSAAPQVRVPAATQAGDLLVLFGNYGITGAAPATPSGWSLRAQQVGNNMDSYVWTRVATTGDVGATVSTPTSALTKSDLELVAYRGTSGTVSITGRADAGTASHTTPTVTAPAGAWVLQEWADRSSTTTSWTPPAGPTVRDASYGTGGGRVCALVVDSAGAVAGGSVGGQTATTDQTSGQGRMWTVLVS